MFHMTFGFEHCKKNFQLYEIFSVRQWTDWHIYDLIWYWTRPADIPTFPAYFVWREAGEFAVICLGCLISFANRNYLRIPYLTNHCWQISGFSLHEQNLKVKLYYLSSGKHHTALFCFSTFTFFVNCLWLLVRLRLQIPASFVHSFGCFYQCCAIVNLKWNGYVKRVAFIPQILRPLQINSLIYQGLFYFLNITVRWVRKQSAFSAYSQWATIKKKDYCEFMQLYYVFETAVVI